MWSSSVGTGVSGDEDDDDEQQKRKRCSEESFTSRAKIIINQLTFLWLRRKELVVPQNDDFGRKLTSWICKGTHVKEPVSLH